MQQRDTTIYGPGTAPRAEPRDLTPEETVRLHRILGGGQPLDFTNAASVRRERAREMRRRAVRRMLGSLAIYWAIMLAVALVVVGRAAAGVG